MERLAPPIVNFGPDISLCSRFFHMLLYFRHRLHKLRAQKKSSWTYEFTAVRHRLGKAKFWLIGLNRMLLEVGERKRGSIATFNPYVLRRAALRSQFSVKPTKTGRLGYIIAWLARFRRRSYLPELYLAAIPTSCRLTEQSVATRCTSAKWQRRRAEYNFPVWGQLLYLSGSVHRACSLGRNTAKVCCISCGLQN